MVQPWDPMLDECFQKERSQAFFDLVALVRPRPGMGVLDFGCGTGERKSAHPLHPIDDRPLWAQR